MIARIPAILITDHHLFVDLITPVLSRLGLQIIAQFDFIKPGLEFLHHHQVKVVLIDQVMPTADGPGRDQIYERTGIAISWEVTIDAVRHIRRHHPDIKIIAVAEDRDPARCARLVWAGVHGIVCKPCGLSDFKQVVSQVLKGEALAVPEQLTQPLKEQLAHPLPKLTAQDQRILRLVQKGLSNKQIASRLNIQPTTVRNHFARISSKLKASNRVDAVIKALAYGLLDDSLD